MVGEDLFEAADRVHCWKRKVFLTEIESHCLGQKGYCGLRGDAF